MNQKSISAIDPFVAKSKGLFKQMIEDKRAMHAYIHEHGTLIGNLSSLQNLYEIV